MMLRRSFLSRLSAAAAAFGVGHPQASAAPAGPFEAARHAQDDWLDQLPGSHRVVFDTWSADHFEDAPRFANNYFRINKDTYGLSEREFAVVMIVRHRTAPFAFNDAMWAKYGKAFGERMQLTDPKTHQAPTANLYREALMNLIKQGMHLGVCNLTTRSLSQRLAETTGPKMEDVYKELTSNTLGNSHFVPAGVVAVTRAQERGYVLVSVG
jgi:hypothetical protein